MWSLSSHVFDTQHRVQPPLGCVLGRLLWSSCLLRLPCAGAGSHSNEGGADAAPREPSWSVWGQQACFCVKNTETDRRWAWKSLVLEFPSCWLPRIIQEKSLVLLTGFRRALGTQTAVLWTQEPGCVVGSQLERVVLSAHVSWGGTWLSCRLPTSKAPKVC